MAKRTLSIPFSRARLTEIREKKGLTLAALAARCTEQGYPVHLSAISKVEVGTNGPSAQLVTALANALRVDVEDLMDPKAGESDGRNGDAPTGASRGSEGPAPAAVAVGPAVRPAGSGPDRAAASSSR